MTSGVTTTGSLSDSLPVVIDAARTIREFPGQVPKLAERHTLPEGTGLSWDEVELAQMTAQGITETTILENAQEFSDTLRSVTPTVTGITTIVTDRTYRRISKNVVAQMGKLAMEAIERKRDEDGIATFDGATNSQPGANTTLTSGVISAAVSNITGNTTEGADGPLNFVPHPFQLKDIQDEVTAGIGSYNVPEGISEEFFRKGFMGTLFGANVFWDGNISIDSASDAKGGVFAKKGLLYIQGHSPRTEPKRRPEYGGGADQMFLYDEYTFAERRPASTSVWIWEIYSDATAPTN